MMDLPITDKELELIIEMVKSRDQKLYNKLWTYKFNFKNIKTEK
jgi:hypothetical protein